MEQSSRYQPQPADNRFQVESMCRQLLGETIEDITYFLWPPLPSLNALERQLAYEADTVEVRFSSGSVFRVRWALVGDSEGVSLELDPELLNSRTLQAIDVSRLAKWSGVINEPVIEMRTAWYSADGGLPELAWAVSLVTTSGGLTVALGEERDGGLRYLPTSVVALTPHQARSYIPPGDIASAWGEKSCGGPGRPG